jgi:predicted small lipoprotein YifL
MKKKSLFGIAFIVLLAGCGQKGPLYLPQPQKPAPEASKPAPAPVLKPDTSGK